MNKKNLTAKNRQKANHPGGEAVLFWGMTMKYRVLLFSLCLLILLGGLGTLGWQWQEQERLESLDQQIQIFRQKTFEDFKKGKKDSLIFLDEVSQIAASFKNHLALGPFLLEMADELLKQKKPKEVADLLVKYEQKFTPSPYIKTLLGFQLAAAYEDLKQYPKAILILNGLINTKLLEDKIYFDLGRYYQFIGETTKSRQSFDHVIKQHPHSNFSKLAEVYAHKIQ